MLLLRMKKRFKILLKLTSLEEAKGGDKKKLHYIKAFTVPKLLLKNLDRLTQK